MVVLVFPNNVTNDEKRLDVHEGFIKCSEHMTNMIQDLGELKDDSILHVDSSTLDYQTMSEFVEFVDLCLLFGKEDCDLVQKSNFYDIKKLAEFCKLADYWMMEKIKNKCFRMIKMWLKDHNVSEIKSVFSESSTSSSSTKYEYSDTGRHELKRLLLDFCANSS